ncbi:hypothetical protein MS3_00002481 [Schistosoma haematobium]|uniref:DM9 domain-containing protein n=2 Tax=Schistosoma haematobium TaxID=6185 RepID=A0A922LU28_SCHHA|nr:hypothetical protein MS3_00002481 [Schistosoma haematobium]KAH9593910.1 hypothetical protein MS3_00002481 [Schistosoma haematobium]CAH8434426.1 unnamed protein product [Schistosoma haematobium]CAH8434502.1 unnamed protein product [Schistosoma haematobium]
MDYFFLNFKMTTPFYVRQSHLSWVSGTAGKDQPTNGVEADSRIYVARGEVNGHVIPGKLPLRIGAAFIPCDGKEHGLCKFEILCNTNVFPNQSLYNWIPASDGRVPAGALLAGSTTDGLPLYVARASINNEMCVGKVNSEYECALMPWGNVEHKVKEYDVLCLIE